MSNASQGSKASKKPAQTKTKGNAQGTATWGSILPIAASIVAILVILPLVAFMSGYIVTKVPQPEDMVTNQVTVITTSDGNTEIARVVPPEGNRENVSLSQVPDGVINAVLAAEDRDYYSNPGFSVTGFGRAALGQLTGRDAGGGSTITQQYVKNAVVGNERSLSRKARELVMSAKMSREWSKDEILEAYLNTIYFGRGAYGIGAAAKAYFGKPVEELSPAEGAVLASAIQAPSVMDPWTNRDTAEPRWNYVLDGMVASGTMSQEERDNAEYPPVTDPATSMDDNDVEGTNGLIRNQVLKELSDIGIDANTLNTLGLKVVTTIDDQVQSSVMNAVDGYMPGYPEDYHTAVVSIDPRNGAVKGYYGGSDPNGFDYANAGLQTGSTFKIFTLAAALNQGIPLSRQYDSSPVTSGDITITNVDGQSCGTCDIATALKMSLNTSFIRQTKELNGGAQDVADMAHRLGIAKSIPGIEHTLTENGGTPYEGISLGQYQSRPLDMASGLATLANSGEYYVPHFIQSVYDDDGNLLYEHPSNDGKQVVDSAVADNVIDAMKPIAAYSNGHTLAGGRVSAAKTGTAQLGETGYNKDAWMIGATPQLATAVWVGSEGPTGVGGMYGSGLPADIWKSTMDGALANEPYENFPAPASIGGQAGAPAPVIIQTTEQPEPEEKTEEPAEPEVPRNPIRPDIILDDETSLGDIIDSILP